MMKQGIFNYDMDIPHIPQDQLLLNHLQMNNGVLKVCGSDPYLCFTSERFMGKLEWLCEMKQNLYLFLTLILSLIGIVIILGRKYAD